MSLEFELVEESAECEDNIHQREVSKGKMRHVKDCAIACMGEASLFIYGKWGRTKTACSDQGCDCFCEKSTSRDHECLKQQQADTFDLYRLTEHKGRRFFPG